MPRLDEFHWWQRATLYQVYVRSFFDTDGDGVGDLPGVIAKLDYLAWLGVKAIWLSPIYPSPLADFGYDVADYRTIDPRYGTLADFDRLLEAVHRQNMKLLMDFVPNHTSCQHPWFVDSRSSRDSAHRDWYLWHDPAPGGGPPNNWISQLNDSTWTFDATTGQYYLHTFLPAQPDLNWRNPQVRLAMLDVMRFWLDRGVDGFRIDAVAHLIKDGRFRENPENPDFEPGELPIKRQIDCFLRDQPEVHEVIQWFRQLVDLYDDRILIGETYLALGRLLSYYGPTGLNFPFNFELIKTSWQPASLRAAIDSYEASLAPDDWPSWVLGNHDRPRVSTRAGESKLRLAALLLLTLRGTPTLYYGDELGMLDLELSADQVLDPRGKAMPGFGRDPERAPMAWDQSRLAGFSAADPWLPLPADCRRRNVAAEQADDGSLLNLYRRLLLLRGEQPALQVGDYAPVCLHRDVVAYIRGFGGSQFLVVLNFASNRLTLPLPDPFVRAARIFSTGNGPAGRQVANAIEVGPLEGQILAREDQTSRH
ncbi:MAG TPA: alpha-amylase family glycosyl hydrolase [Pirellulales bacterium]|jgi:alpha-glucosidase|nr:alpha-amylase family glycosyl hydrolase [Pirellulales bacterium]